MSKQLLASGTYEGEAWECYRESGRLFWTWGHMPRIDLCESKAVLALLGALEEAKRALEVEVVERDEAIKEYGKESGFWGRSAARLVDKKNSLTKERDEARAALERAAHIFRLYAEKHFTKKTPEGDQKARANLGEAKLIEAALSGASQAHDGEGLDKPPT